ncbi:MAG: hypothetical protein WCC87_20325 [Candidatus Korobacteraceae bacterium]
MGLPTRRLTLTLAFVLCTLTVCIGQQAKHPAKKVKAKETDASVSIDNNCKANYPSVTISTDGQVTWTPGSNGATINFVVTPFSQATYTINGPTATPSGKPNDLAIACAEVLGTCSFKYTISESNGCSVDPIVIITK